MSLILDIGDVLLTWSSHTTTLPSATIRTIITSPTWFAYECNLLSQQDCYKQVSEALNLQYEDVSVAFEEAHQSLTPNHELINFIRELKTKSHGKLRVFAMSNMPKPDFDRLLPTLRQWLIFDGYYGSCTVGERKPNLRFYQHVIKDASIDPARCVFLDDNSDNVLSARSLGLHGIVYRDCQDVMRQLNNQFGDPLARGKNFLIDNAGNHESLTDNGIVVHENFAQLLILEATRDKTLITIDAHQGAWKFFRGKPMLTTEEFPCDLDTTAIALCVTNPKIEVATTIMDDMLEYLNRDGIIQTYFDHQRPRIDPVVCINVLTLFFKYGRGHELDRTFDWVHKVLLYRAYIDGTRYYATPECFLYFLSRLLLLKTLPRDKRHALKPLLKERVRERIGAPGDALALAMRILVCASVGITDATDRRALLEMQCNDGGWEMGWIYKYGSKEIKLGNRGLTTALALNALNTTEKKDLRKSLRRMGRKFRLMS
ncbi:hypothetical protein AMATHDRAFT_151387 [Amanita thiersii Skay4041]|uniref:HAD-like protein n=1 Tax=Amanita thiersii Skay4041 TaxID=703135 RepID=A0A2A9NAU1_9AGAR|nr:hypothetical protein AMATHDRAFT_151387 [Amanita thiersii Skay4041]